MRNRIKIAPSVLSADFACLAQQVREAEEAGADYIHVDVMDGRYVPNLTIGPIVVEAIHRSTSLPLDVHLMIVEPEQYIGEFVRAGASIVTVHAEATVHLHRTIQQIKEAGARAGVSLNPSTPEVMLDYVLPELDLVLVMSVNPGFGGQQFIPAVLPKLQRLRERIDALGVDTELEVDGGINESTVRAVVDAGADVLVAGSAIFNQRESVAAAMDRLRRALTKPVA